MRTGAVTVGGPIPSLSWLHGAGRRRPKELTVSESWDDEELVVELDVDDDDLDNEWDDEDDEDDEGDEGDEVE